MNQDCLHKLRKEFIFLCFRIMARMAISAFLIILCLIPGIYKFMVDIYGWILQAVWRELMKVDDFLTNVFMYTFMSGKKLDPLTLIVLSVPSLVGWTLSNYVFPFLEFAVNKFGYLVMAIDDVFNSFLGFFQKYGDQTKKYVEQAQDYIKQIDAIEAKSKAGVLNDSPG